MTEDKKTIQLYGKTISVPEGELGLYTRFADPYGFLIQATYVTFTPERLEEASRETDRGDFLEQTRGTLRDIQDQMSTRQITILRLAKKPDMLADLPDYDEKEPCLERARSFLEQLLEELEGGKK